jgi:hypothetical protein
LQDPTQQDQSNLFNLSAATAAGVIGGSYGANDWGGTRAPDIVGAVRVDQAWGLFQFSAVAHDQHAAYYGTTEVTGHPEDKWGWAVQAALSIKNIPTGAGDTLNLQVVYTDGASRYNFQSLMPQAFAFYSGTSLAGGYQSIGFAGIADGTFTTGSSIENVTTWGFRGGFTHNWSPTWSSSIYGAYAQLRYGGAAKATICGAGGPVSLIGFSGTSCNPDFDMAVIGGNVVWKPVNNLAFTADINWARLDQKFGGTFSGAGTGVAAIAKPAAVYEAKDQDHVSVLLRAQRNF